MKHVLRWRRLELAGFASGRERRASTSPPASESSAFQRTRQEHEVARPKAIGSSDCRARHLPRDRASAAIARGAGPKSVAADLTSQIDGRISRIRREMVTHHTIVDEIDSEERSIKLSSTGSQSRARAAGRQSYRGFLDELLGDWPIRSSSPRPS